MNFAQAWDKAQHYRGWCSMEKAVSMYELVVAISPKLCVEIGVFGGRSLSVTAMALRDARSDGIVWGIDPWTKDAALENEKEQANRDWWTSIDIEGVRDDAIRRLNQDGLARWAKIIVAQSREAAPLFSGIDMLHIDGNHNEECSVEDVQLWIPRVRQGGYIWFDDVNWVQTRKAVELIEGGMGSRIRDVHAADGGMSRLYVKQ